MRDSLLALMCAVVGVGCTPPESARGAWPTNAATPPDERSFVLIVGGSVESTAGTKSFVATRELHSNDLIHLDARTTRPALLYVAYCDTAQKLAIYPTIGELRVPAETQVRIPANGHFRVDSRIGAESIYVIATAEPLDRADPTLQRTLLRAQGADGKEPCAPELRMTTDESRAKAGLPVAAAGAAPGAAKVKRSVPPVAPEWRPRGLEVVETPSDTLSARSDTAHIAILAFMRTHVQ